MKKRDLIRQLRVIAGRRGLDFALAREGRNHEIWIIGNTRLVIPRHREVNERTARGILSRALEVRDDD